MRLPIAVLVIGSLTASCSNPTVEPPPAAPAVELRRLGRRRRRRMRSTDAPRLSIRRPRVAQIKGEGDPPHEIVGQAEHDRSRRPLAAGDEHAETDGAEELAQEADGGDEKTALGDARDLGVEDAINTHDHSDAREDRRVVEGRQARETEEPLRVDRGVDAPKRVVKGREQKDDAMEAAARDHAPAQGKRSQRGP